MKKILIPILALVVFNLSSCKKDEKDDNENENPMTTVAEDKANIKASLDGVIECMETFKSGDFVTTAVNFLGMSNGTANEDVWVGDLFDSLFTEADFEYLENEQKFILANHYGTYTYNIDNHKWDRAKNLTDKAVFIFPSNKSATSNDMKLIVGSYSDSPVNLDSGQVFMPKTGAIQLYKNGSEIAHIILNNFSWEAVSSTQSIPTNISGSIMMSPFTYKFEMNRNNPTEFVASIDVTSNSSCGYHVDATLNLNNSDYFDLDDEEIDNLKVNFNYGNFTLKLNADIDGIAALGEDPSTDQINSKFDTKVYFASLPIAKIYFSKDANSNIMPYIEYKDKTSENVDEAYMKDFMNRLENVFVDIVGE